MAAVPGWAWWFLSDGDGGGSQEGAARPSGVRAGFRWWRGLCQQGTGLPAPAREPIHEVGAGHRRVLFDQPGQDLAEILAAPFLLDQPRHAAPQGREGLAEAREIAGGEHFAVLRHIAVARCVGLGVPVVDLAGEAEALMQDGIGKLFSEGASSAA